MIAQNFTYSSPRSLQEALSLLSDGAAKPLAGGMSLIPLMKLRLAAPEHLVDLRSISELKGIRHEGDQIRIGALVTHHEIETSTVLKTHCPLLPEAAARIGDMHVRHAGTIGGSISHADPAADYPASLLALECQVRLQRSGSERTLAFNDFLVDTMTTAVEPGEIVAEIIVPAERAGSGVSYQKFVHPASGFAITGVAARISKEAGKLSHVRIGITGVAPRAYRATQVEQRLEGSDGSPDAIESAAALAGAGVDANADIHASADYRRRLAQVFTSRAVIQALSRIE